MRISSARAYAKYLLAEAVCVATHPLSLSVRFEFEYTRPQMSNADIIEDLRRVAAIMAAEHVSRNAYLRHGKFSHSTVKKRFGSWNQAVMAAGLVVSSVRDISDELLFDNLREAWISLSRQPRKLEMRPPVSQYTVSPYVRRFGSWVNALRTFTRAVADSEAEVSSDRSGTLDLGTTPRSPSLRLRFVIMRRDRFRCVICGRSPAADPAITLHVDHVIAWAHGGSTSLSNLRTLCSDCNLGKGSLAAETA